MQGDQPVEADDLVLSQRAIQQEGHLGLHVGTRERGACRLEALCHLDRLLSYLSELVLRGGELFIIV